MKAAQLEENEKSLREYVLILNDKEVQGIYAIVKEYSEANKKKTNAKKLLKALEQCPIFG